MSKFIVVPEPHISSNNISGRQDYLSEIKEYMNYVCDRINDDKEIKWLVLPGDVFDRGFSNIEEYFYWVDWFTDMDKTLAERGGCIYSAVGNHELSFSRANPFWRFVSKDDNGYQTNCEWNSKAASPKGSKSLIHVADIVEFENMTLFFCHYDKIMDCKKLVLEHINKYGDDKVRICICHNSIISNVIANVLRKNYGRDPLTHFIAHENIESLDFFHLFDIVFNGHMHKAYSKFTLTDEDTGNKTYLMYLASLGRTNSEEINDSDLVRTLPIIDVDSCKMESFNIRLIPRERALLPDYDKSKEEKKHDEMEYQEVCRNIVDINNPMKELFEAIDDRDMLVAFECARDGIKPKDLSNLLNLAERMY